MNIEQNITSSNRELLDSIGSVQELETRLSMTDRLPLRHKVWTQIVYIDGGLDNFLSKKRPSISSSRQLSGGGAILNLDGFIGRKRKVKYSGQLAFLPSSVSGIYRIIVISDSAFWNKIASKFIEHGYPYLVRIFYRQAELKQTLFDFEQSISSKLKIAVTEMTLKEKRIIIGGSEKKNKEFDSERKWTDSSLRKVFSEADERRQWFRSLRLDIMQIGKDATVATIRVSKHGLIAQDHLYDLCNKNLFPALDKIAYAKTVLFSGRGLRERQYIPANPIAVDYTLDVFNDKKNVRKLASVIKSYPNSSKAIYHGNPYLHVSLADFIDGSSFEIWVLSPRRIILIPQVKATVPSFEKLVTHIFEKFKEGEVREYANA